MSDALRDEAQALLNKARRAQRAGDVVAAEAYLARLVEKTDGGGVEVRALRGSAFLEQAELARGAGAHEAATTLEQRAASLAKEPPEEPALAWAHFLRELSRAFQWNPVGVDPGATAESALALAEQRLGAEAPGLTPFLVRMASFCQHQGLHELAIPHLERAVRIEEGRERYRPARLGRMLGMLARSEHARGAGEWARELQGRALELLEDGLGVDHADTAGARARLVAWLEEAGAADQIEALYADAVARVEAAREGEDTALGGLLLEQAEACWRLGNGAQAEAAWERAQELARRRHGEDSPEVVQVLQARLRAGSAGAAPEHELPPVDQEGLLEEAIRRLEASPEPDAPTLRDLLGDLAVLYLKAGREEEAEALLDRADALLSAEAQRLLETSLSPDELLRRGVSVPGRAAAAPPDSTEPVSRAVAEVPERPASAPGADRVPAPPSEAGGEGSAEAGVAPAVAGLEAALNLARAQDWDHAADALGATVQAAEREALAARAALFGVFAAREFEEAAAAVLEELEAGWARAAPGRAFAEDLRDRLRASGLELAAEAVAALMREG